MDFLIQHLNYLRETPLREEVEERLSEFASFQSKSSRKWFSELCFCILAANAKGENAFKIQKQIGTQGLISYPENKIRSYIRKNNHRFHNNKAKYISEARSHLDIKQEIKKIIDKKGEESAREWLVSNIKGIGYKEASHFLRNIGYKNLAILDRHIINMMSDHNIIEKPKSLNKKNYLEIEKKFKTLSRKIKMSPAELDLYMWYMKTGEVLK